MAMDIRLVKANEMLCNIAFDHGTDSEEFKAANKKWIEVFKVVAAERGEPVIAWENPYDSIMDAINDYVKPGTIEAALTSFKQMLDALESINYSRLDEWKANYEECVAAWEAIKGGEEK